MATNYNKGLVSTLKNNMQFVNYMDRMPTDLALSLIGKKSSKGFEDESTNNNPGLLQLLRQFRETTNRISKLLKVLD